LIYAFTCIRVFTLNVIFDIQHLRLLHELIGFCALYLRLSFTEFNRKYKKKDSACIAFALATKVAVEGQAVKYNMINAMHCLE
jgi:hypothetical protein